MAEKGFPLTFDNILRLKKFKRQLEKDRQVQEFRERRRQDILAREQRKAAEKKQKAETKAQPKEQKIKGEGGFVQSIKAKKLIERHGGAYTDNLSPVENFNQLRQQLPPDKIQAFQDDVLETFGGKKKAAVKKEKTPDELTSKEIATRLNRLNKLIAKKGDLKQKINEDYEGTEEDPIPTSFFTQIQGIDEEARELLGQLPEKYQSINRSAFFNVDEIPGAINKPKSGTQGRPPLESYITR
jgi:hypothetical protein